ncbi:phage holin family protein [Patescibacteria group bacterium]|nr:phage holin family protein [Patescibacteria group bacterium]
MLRRAVIGIIVNALSLYVLVEFLEEVTGTGGIKLFIIGGIIIGLLNFIVKPIMKILSMPFVVLTAGLFLIVINAFVLYLAEWTINTMAFRDVTLNFLGIGSYLIGAVVFGVVNWAINLLVKD